MRSKLEQIELLNDAFNRDRTARDCRNDNDYASALGISAKQLSFWRTGRWTALDAILIGILLNDPTVVYDPASESSA
jgi:hypothetical protein